MSHSHGGSSGSGMSMDMGTSMFQADNMALARNFWYFVAAAVGLLALRRVPAYYESRTRLRRHAAKSVHFPTQPANAVLQAWATATAVLREASYPQLVLPARLLPWLSPPPPLGRLLVLGIYWAVIIYMMCDGAIIKDVWFWERIGFRNAWVTVTQVPLLYLLASKRNVLAVLVGTSYERLNWLHRWVARTIFITASVHGWHFWMEWTRAGRSVLEAMLDMMTMVKYGLGAWGLLLFALVASLAPIRRAAYEVFVAWHIASAVAFLVLVYLHVPWYAQYNVWFAVAAYALDRACRFVLLIWRNMAFPSSTTQLTGSRVIPQFGYQATFHVIPGSSSSSSTPTTIVTIKDVRFTWRAGQHVYLNLSRLTPFEAHPYTIASVSSSSSAERDSGGQKIELVVRAQSGFSRRLHLFARKKIDAGQPDFSLMALLSGPYGEPPRWDTYETLILISASTGASFTLPILESVLRAKRPTTCVKRVDVVMVAKTSAELDFYVDRIRDILDQEPEHGIELRIDIAVTQDLTPSSHTSSTIISTRSHEKRISNGSTTQEAASTSQAVMSTATVSAHDVDAEKGSRRNSSTSPLSSLQSRQEAAHGSDRHQSIIRYARKRPDIEAVIREPVEATGGETSVVVCGEISLVASVRNCVAALSDERAVHKGTGAQGIHLHVEEYSF